MSQSNNGTDDRRKTFVRRSNTMRSLIQPMMVPCTPDKRESVNRGQNIGEPGRRKVGTQANNSRTYSDPIKSKKPSNTMNIGDDNVNRTLQELAKKESEILEKKRKVQELQRQLHIEQTSIRRSIIELENLKRTVEAIMNSPSNHNEITYNFQADTIEKSEIPDNQSVWSKPLSLFNQFDQIIQQEFDKNMSIVGNNLRRYDSDDDSDDNNGEDLGVSQSIWNFVNDVKTGLLGIDSEENQNLHRNVNDTNGRSRQKRPETTSAYDRKEVTRTYDANGSDDDITIGVKQFNSTATNSKRASESGKKDSDEHTANSKLIFS